METPVAEAKTLAVAATVASAAIEVLAIAAKGLATVADDGQAVEWRLKWRLGPWSSGSADQGLGSRPVAAVATEASLSAVRVVAAAKVSASVTEVNTLVAWALSRQR